MYEFESIREAEVYNFRVLNKIISSSILAVVEEFEENKKQYIVTDYAEMNLLQLQTSQSNQVFALPVALDYFAKVISGLEELH